MVQFIRNAVVILLAINAVILLGSVVSGVAFVFNPIFNVPVPIICAAVATGEEIREEKKQMH